MKSTKRFISILFAIFTVMSCFWSGTVSAEESVEEQSYVYAEDLKDGEYSIEVKSSSSMFKIVECTLNVSGGEMNAVMTLSGTGYEKLFMGTSEEALDANDESCIYFVENSDGAYTYTVPVEALNMDIDCAAWSIRKEKWYDRVLVFKSDTLPEEAYAGGLNPIIIVIPIAVILVVVIAVVVIVNIKKRKNKDS